MDTPHPQALPSALSPHSPATSLHPAVRTPKRAPHAGRPRCPGHRMAPWSHILLCRPERLLRRRGVCPGQDPRGTRAGAGERRLVCGTIRPSHAAAAGPLPVSVSAGNHPGEPRAGRARRTGGLTTAHCVGGFAGREHRCRCAVAAHRVAPARVHGHHDPAHDPGRAGPKNDGSPSTGKHGAGHGNDSSGLRLRVPALHHPHQQHVELDAPPRRASGRSPW